MTNGAKIALNVLLVALIAAIIFVVAGDSNGTNVVDNGTNTPTNGSQNPSDSNNGTNGQPDNGQNNNAATYKDLVKLAQPLPSAKVESPLVFKGEARGSWFFEASFPVSVTDKEGNVLVQHFAMTSADWMTTDYVPFETTLNFTVPAGVTEGYLVLEKDNPSGLPENADQFKVPVHF